MIKNKIKILGVEINNITLGEGREEVRKWLKSTDSKHYIVTPNPEFVMRAQKDKEFLTVINNASLALPDGMGIVWAGKILGKPFEERVTGVDFMLKLCEMAENEGFSIGLIGAGENVAVKAGECLKKKYPRLKIKLATEEWMEDLSLIDILFIAFGAPKQEKWISQNLDKIPVRVAMGVGGAFDYLAGEVPRAPIWMQNLGLEWLFRLFKQPWRLGRQLAIWKFGWLVILERIKLLSHNIFCILLLTL